MTVYTWNYSLLTKSLTKEWNPRLFVYLQIDCCHLYKTKLLKNRATDTVKFKYDQILEKKENFAKIKLLIS